MDPETSKKGVDMRENMFVRWIKELSIGNKFTVLIILIVIALTFGGATFWFGMKVISGARAYAVGESILSKAHKGAIISLLKYSDSYDDTEYDRFQAQISFLVDSRKIRDEMKKDRPDWAMIRSGLEGMGMGPADADNVVFLYKFFRRMDYMREIIRIWETGTQPTEELIAAAREMREIISSHGVFTSHQELDQAEDELAPLLRKVYILDSELTAIEKNFSISLSQGSEKTRNLMSLAIAITNIILDILVLAAAFVIERVIAGLDRSKSEFISLASHQLRTPPTSMKWLLEMLLSGDAGPLNPKQKEYAEEVYKNNQRMITLANLLLNSSKMELGSSAVMKEEVNVADIAKLVLKEYEFDMKEKELSLEESYEESLPSGMADAKLLRIVFQNIVWNAIKYTPKGGRISLKVSSKAGAEKTGSKLTLGKGLIVTISDTGYGIPEKEYDKVFTKLFRASNIQEKDTEGTGLGLYLSKLIMNRMEGDIWFESKVNQGTSFYLFIPLPGKDIKG